MANFKVGKAPTFKAHILSHDGKAFRLDFPDLIAAQWVWISDPAAAAPVKKRRKHQTVPMTVSANEQHCPAHGLETHAAAPAQIVHMCTSVVRPGIEVEGAAAVI